MKNLNFADVAGIALSWAGAGMIVYLVQNEMIALVCVVAAYYLSKWIIFKEEK